MVGTGHSGFRKGNLSMICLPDPTLGVGSFELEGVYVVGIGQLL